MPPNESYKCQYVSIWMKIKAIWQLTVNKDELAAIEKVVSEKNCALSQMEIDSSGLDIERAATENVPDQCQTFGTAPPPQFPNGKNKPPETTPVTPVPAPTPVPPPVMPPAPQNGVAPDPAPVPAPSGV